MGHFRLGQLPRTARWKQVIALLQRGASVEELAQASFKAAQTGLSRVPDDPGFTQTLTTVFQFIDALQSGNPISSLRKQGFDIKEGASLFDFVGSFKARAAEAANSARARSDIGEIARDSFAQVLMKSAGGSLQTLFGVESKDAQKTLQASLKGKPLGSTMHEFFSTFTQRYLNYYLGRAVPSFVGSGRAFANTESHSEFNRAFDLYVRQTVRIADEFTPGWFGKAKWEGRLSHGEVSKFAHVAFKKIGGEFKRGAEVSG